MINLPSGSRLLTPIATKAPPVLLLLASLAVLSIASYCATLKPLTHDEAFLLQAADSLSKGEGYASYGVMRGDGPWLFDPHLTVGPVILAPLSVILRPTTGDITAIRIFMLCFLWLYVSGLFLLFNSKRLVHLPPALAIASSLCIVKLPAGLILGELPAATALIWAAWAVKRNRPYMAAMLAGLAVQIKLVYALAGVILLLAWAIPPLFSTSRFNLKYCRDVISVYAVFVFPTLMFELWRFLSFPDLNSWLDSLEKFVLFLQNQNINTTRSWLDDQVLEQKFLGLAQALPASAWLAVGAATLPILIWTTRRLASSKFHPGPPASSRLSQVDSSSLPTGAAADIPLAVILGLMAAGMAMLGGWITQSANVTIRQALPFFLLFIPTLFALSGYCYCRLFCTGSLAKKGFATRTATPLGILLCAALLGMAMAGRAIDILGNEREKGERIRWEQDVVLGIIRNEDVESLFVDTYAGGRWQAAVYQLLSPIRAVPIRTGRSQIMIVSSYVARRNQLSLDAYLTQCGSLLYSSKSMLLCRLPDFEKDDVDLQIVDWGPKYIRYDTLPDKQAHGGMGVWIKVRPVDVQRFGPAEIYLAGQPAFTTDFMTTGAITGELPTRLLAKPGKHALEVKQLARDRVFHVGHFAVVREPGPIGDLPTATIAEVDRWGPRSGGVSEGFNLQADGSSAIWILFDNIAQHPYEIYFGTSPLKTSVRSEQNLVTASATKLQAEQLTASPGEIAVHLVDLLYGTKQLVGHFRIQATATGEPQTAHAPGGKSERS